VACTASGCVVLCISAVFSAVVGSTRCPPHLGAISDAVTWHLSDAVTWHSAWLQLVQSPAVKCHSLRLAQCGRPVSRQVLSTRPANKPFMPLVPIRAVSRVTTYSGLMGQFVDSHANLHPASLPWWKLATQLCSTLIRPTRPDCLSVKLPYTRRRLQINDKEV
jgi:hypothetical protein